MSHPIEFIAGRVIGLHHRVKLTRDGKKHPTQIAILDLDQGSEIIALDLRTEDDEMDFLRGRLPVEWQPVDPEAIIPWFNNKKPKSDTVRAWHCKWRRPRKDEDVSSVPENHILNDSKGKPTHVLTHIPIRYEGLRDKDCVVTIFGGSGGYLTHSFSQAGIVSGDPENPSIQVHQIPPFKMAEKRNGRPKDQDHITLIQLWYEEPELFQRVHQNDMDVIDVEYALRIRRDAMTDRIACDQRLLSRHRYQLFLRSDAWPEGTISDSYAAARASDEMFTTMLAIERKCDKQLSQAVEATILWQDLFSHVEGCGPVIAASLIGILKNLQRFRATSDPTGKDRSLFQLTANRVKAYLGVHVKQGGKYKDVDPSKQFPRKRAGEVANWQTVARQGLFQLGDQFNRRPNSYWGKRLLENKIRLREIHPEPVEFEGKDEDGKPVTKKRYTDGHILRMAKWRTITQFVKWMTRQWLAIEEGKKPDFLGTEADKNFTPQNELGESDDVDIENILLLQDEDNEAA